MNQPSQQHGSNNFEKEKLTNTELETYLQLKLAANNPHRINQRLQELDGAWDVERALQLNAVALAITGIALSLTGNKKWLMLPIAATALLAQQAIQGWNPASPIFKIFGLPNRSEINREKLGLKLLRGDMGAKMQDGDQVWQVVKDL